MASGSNSHKVHFSPGRARIGKGLVIVDMGMRRNRYCSDLTRMYPSGLTAKQDAMLDTCRSLQKELISMATPGTKFQDLQKVYSTTLKKQCLRVMQSFGHGIGLGVHERPGRGDVLEKGMVITVEPGLYKKGIGGCRIEDMILVSNKPRILSK